MSGPLIEKGIRIYHFNKIANYIKKNWPEESEVKRFHLLNDMDISMGYCWFGKKEFICPVSEQVDFFPYASINLPNARDGWAYWSPGKSKSRVVAALIEKLKSERDRLRVEGFPVGVPK